MAEQCHGETHTQDLQKEIDMYNQVTKNTYQIFIMVHFSDDLHQL